jgi:hypothetical protein
MASPDTLRDTETPLAHGSGAVPAIGFGMLISDLVAIKKATNISPVRYRLFREKTARWYHINFARGPSLAASRLTTHKPWSAFGSKCSPHQPRVGTSQLNADWYEIALKLDFDSSRPRLTYRDEAMIGDAAQAAFLQGPVVDCYGCRHEGRKPA